MQDNIAISADNKITGTLKYINSGALATDWGAGYFLALNWTGIDAHATSVRVGLVPSQGSGLIEAINDPDHNGVFKITDKDRQKFTLVQSDSTGTYTKTTQSYDLSGLTLSNQ